MRAYERFLKYAAYPTMSSEETGTHPSTAKQLVLARELAKEQCENNAEAEGVADRIKFRKGDAGNMEFASESFEAAVSNFVFHEVRSQSDKRQVVREALRVVKKGGSFAFQDMFEQKALYGDMNAFIEELKAEGIAEIHYIGNVEKEEFIPKFVTAPWMIKGVGLIYGKK